MPGKYLRKSPLVYMSRCQGIICENLPQFIYSDARVVFAKISLSLYVVMPGNYLRKSPSIYI